MDGLLKLLHSRASRFPRGVSCAEKSPKSSSRPVVAIVQRSLYSNVKVRTLSHVGLQIGATSLPELIDACVLRETFPGKALLCHFFFFFFVCSKARPLLRAEKNLSCPAER